jgi:hypothetical protein
LGRAAQVGDHGSFHGLTPFPCKYACCGCGIGTALERCCGRSLGGILFVRTIEHQRV